MSCNVCGNFLNNSKYVVKEMMFGFQDEFGYFECSKCGCLQIVSVPDNLEKYYPSIYYSFKKPNTGRSKLRQFVSEKQMTNALTGNSKLIGGTLNRILPIFREWLLREGLLGLRLTKQSRILDVGCGGGDLISTLADAGFQNVLGIDAYVKADIIYDNGVRVRKTVLEDVSGEYDLVVFNHSFEHMTEQLESLKSVNSLLAKNGVCLLNMPTVSSYAWKHFRENWVQLDAPRHCCIHSQNSIRTLAQKASFEVSKVIYNSWSFQFWGSIQYQKGIYLHSAESYSVNPSKSMFSGRQISDFEKRAREMNFIEQGDAAAFYLRRISSD
jgi:SAM-dependent methyltransferase